jgi:uncharacterized membrane protein YphA (DoxX/SURF4 family)
MGIAAKIRRAPVRAATGAFILNSGVDKLRAGDDHAKGLHGFASGAYPMVEKIDPKLFTRALGLGEVALGTTLLLPIAPPLVAGLGLVAFSGGLLGLYWRTPGLHRAPNDPRPTQDGIPIAKDAWMFGIGTSLVVDSLLDGARDKRLEAQRQMSKFAAVNRERARGRSRLARARAREAKAMAKANAHAMTARPMAKGEAYLNTAKGMADRVAHMVS